jgi:hypothetical protein
MSLNGNQGIINVTGEAGGLKSRCYNSDLRLTGQTPSRFSFRCYETICSPSGRTLTVRVGQTLIFCMFPNQLLTVKGYEGTLRCPDSFSNICSVQRCRD